MHKSILSAIFILTTFFAMSGQKQVEYLENEVYRFSNMFAASGDNALALTNDQKQSIYDIAEKKYKVLEAIQIDKGDKYDLHLAVVKVNDDFETQYEKILSPSQRLYIASKDKKKIKRTASL